MPEDPRLTPDHLHRLCDPSTLGFETTGELETSDTFVLGQDDAVSALSFGLSLADPRYNIFVLAPPDPGASPFHLWAIERVEEGWPILAGLEAGVEGDGGTYPEGTVHRAVQDRLAQWAEEWARTRGQSTQAGDNP